MGLPHLPRGMLFILAGFAVMMGWPATSGRAQPNYVTPYYFTTLAGNGFTGLTDGPANVATFDNSRGLALDSVRTVVVADGGDGRIRKVSLSGVTTTLTGPTGSPVVFGASGGIALDVSGNIYLGGATKQVIEKITPAGVLTIFAGQTGSTGSTNGIGSLARFNGPSGVVVDAGGNVFVADRSNHTIRKITSNGLVTTIAGRAGSAGSVEGIADAARFNFPTSICLDAAGNLYVTDEGNQTIRKITPAGAVTTLAGTAGLQGTLDATGAAARFTRLHAIAVDSSGNIYVADFNTIRKVTSAGVVTSLAGGQGFDGRDGAGPQATFNQPRGIAVDGQGNLFIADSGSFKIRRSVFPPTNVAVTYNGFVEVGTNTQLSAIISSDYPLAYQWAKDGATIAGATTATLTLNNVQTSNAGGYSVTVSNIAGATTTLPAQVFVLVPIVIATNPTSQTVSVGLPVQFGVITSPATGVSYQWRKNGVAISGATNALFSISSATLADAGDYSVIVTNPGSTAVSTAATLTVNVPVSTEPVTHTVAVGAFVQLGFNGTAPTGTTFQWRKQGAPIAGATNSLFVINSATLGDAGNYTVVTTSGTTSQLSNTATLVVVPLAAPVITTQPANQTIVVGTSAQFSVAATSAAAMSFQWRKNGIPVANATGERLIIPSATLLDAGAYSVAVTNTTGATISTNATLVVNLPVVPTPTPVGTPPSFVTQPSDQTINASATLSLSVTVAGTPPFTFQWYKNGTAVPGATAILFLLINVQPPDAASYSIVVTNSAGVATSTPAIVRVIVPPSIATQPASSSVVEGGNLELSVAGAGTGPFTYQWRKDGATITGATGITLAFNPVRLTDVGSYSVTLTNSAGTASSNAARLVVAAAGPSSRFSNLSIRTSLTADQTVIVGLAVEGGSREVLVRAVGPALTTFGISTAMVDPRLELFRGQTSILANDDWAASLAATFANAGAFSLAAGSRDAAFRVGLTGAYSIQARGTGPGVVLLEVYDIGEGNIPRLVNVSARNRVGTGDGVLIAGFTISGTGTKPLLIRAVGPGLAAFGLSGTLLDPKVELFNSANVLISENDNWAATLAPTFTAAGAFALSNGSRDAAMLTSLPPGSYTVQVRGADGGTGEAIVEIYEVP